MRQHLDALSFWHEESEKMSEARLLPFTNAPDSHENLREQVVDILDELMEAGTLDARTGWLQESHH